MTFHMKQTNLLPILKFQLINPDGVPADLTGATLTFSMASAVGVPMISAKPALIIDALTGSGAYVWEEGDTDIEGLHLGEVTATFNGLSITYPNNTYFSIRISDKL